MPRPSAAKQRFIEAALTLFRRSGYNGVGLTEIITASGAPKGSFYHYFPGGKEELGEAVLHLAGAQVGSLIDRCFARGDTFAIGAERFVSVIIDELKQSEWTAGCPVTAIAVDAAATSERLATGAQEVLAGWVERATAHGVRLGMEPEVARDFAERFMIMLEGAWLVARVQKSARPFEQALATLKYR